MINLVCFLHNFHKEENMFIKTMAGIAFQIDEEDQHILELLPKTFIDSAGYVRTRFSGSRSEQGILLHRLILKCPEGLVVDHINHDKLDNRKSNLRICTRANNNKNIKKPTIPNATSQYKGVRWHKVDEKWAARIQVNKNSIWLGNFDSEIAAAERYDDAAAHYHGEYAFFNFPNRSRQPYIQRVPKKTHSKVKGISFDKTRKNNPWAACVQVKGVRWKKRFPTEQEAIAALVKYRKDNNIPS